MYIPGVGIGKLVQ